MRFRWSAPLALVVAACADAPTPTIPGDPEPQALLGLRPAPLDAPLQAALADAAPGDLIEVIIDVDGPVSRAAGVARQLARLDTLDLDQTPAFDPAEPEPDPDLEFDQSRGG